MAQAVGFGLWVEIRVGVRAVRVTIRAFSFEALGLLRFRISGEGVLARSASCFLATVAAMSYRGWNNPQLYPLVVPLCYETLTPKPMP